MNDAARFHWTTIAHAGRALLGPLSPAAVDALLEPVTPPADGRRAEVLDVGCGKGELLLHAMRRLAARGTGVDPNDAFLADARERARALGLEQDLVLHAGTLAATRARLAPADLAICTGATHAFGDLDAAFTGLGGLTRGGGWMLLGTGYWKRPPSPEYLAFLGAEENEMTSLAGALAAAGEHATLVAHHDSGLAEWDEYENGYAAAMRAWIAAHPGAPEASAYAERITAWNAAYVREGRDTLGFVTLLLRR